MKILIVAPKLTRAPGEFYQFPLGLGYISSTLKKAGHTVFCLNCNHTAMDPDLFVEQAVREYQPDVCATGGLSPFLPKVRAIFAAARRAKPDIINVAGGGCLSSDPEAAPSLMDIDVGVIGEGEDTIVDLCAALEEGRDLHTVPGIVFVDRAAGDRLGIPATGLVRALERGLIVRTASRDSIHDLGKLPWPDYDGFGFGEIIDLQRTHDNYFFHTLDRPRSIDMITSRSCPYRCTFCFHPTGKVYRERPLDDFFAELDYLVGHFGINSVAVIDELFSLKRDRLLEFCRKIKPFNLQWMVQLHVNCGDPDILDAMVDAGCTYISYGVESMSNAILESMQKGSRRERIHQVLGYTYDKKIGIQGNLIFGDTSETLATANESMAWWAENRKFMVNVNRLQVYPGSPDYIEAVRGGLITNRTKFIDELAIDLNISKMNDQDLRMLTLFVGMAQSTLLNIAPVKRYEPDVDDGPRPSYRITWGCPRCAHENDYRNVVPFMPPNRRSLRFSCRACRSRFDVRNMTRPKLEDRTTHEADQARLVAALRLLEQGHEEAGVAELKALTECSVWFHPAHTALGRYYQARCAASSLPSAEDKMAEVLSFAVALLENPYEANLHVDFAESLVRHGAHGMAQMHLEQALTLEPGHARALAAQQTLDPALKDQYFVSFSVAEAPKRLLKEGYVKPKREKEFPDIAAIEQEVRTRLENAG